MFIYSLSPELITLCPQLTALLWTRGKNKRNISHNKSGIAKEGDISPPPMQHTAVTHFSSVKSHLSIGESLIDSNCHFKICVVGEWVRSRDYNSSSAACCYKIIWCRYNNWHNWGPRHQGLLPGRQCVWLPDVHHSKISWLGSCITYCSLRSRAINAPFEVYTTNKSTNNS